MSVKFTPKEQFIVASVRMITDERSKKLPRETRQIMLNYIRERLGVSKEEWHEVALNIDQTMRQIADIMERDYRSNNVTADNYLAKIDASVRANIADIDLDEVHAETKHGKKMLDDVKKIRKTFGL
jgi:hypothetical protein